MLLFLNTLAPRAVALLVRGGRVVDRVDWDASLREYDTLLPMLDTLCERAGVSKKDLGGMVCVNGPGSFTGMRTVVLTVNAIARVHATPLMPLDADALGDLFGWQWPRLRRIHRHECALRRSPESEIEILANADVPPGTYWGYATKDWLNEEIVVECGEDYDRLARELRFVPSGGRIAPLYVKRPNITPDPNAGISRIHLLG